MIKASELRVGNWLYGHNPLTMSYKESGYFQVSIIEEEMINVWRVGRWFETTPANGSPIPLTPEILNACGLVKDLMGWESEGAFKLYESPKSDLLFACLNENIASDVPIKYLHQLQNAYYFITGEEIEVNLISGMSKS